MANPMDSTLLSLVEDVFGNLEAEQKRLVPIEDEIKSLLCRIDRLEDRRRECLDTIARLKSVLMRHGW